MRRASNIAAMLAIALVVLGLGGVHTAVAGGALTLALAAVGLQIGYLRSRDHQVLISLVGAAFLLAAVLCWVQLVPMPQWVHVLLNPEGLGVYEAGLKASGLSQTGWRPLSLDPYETSDRSIRYITLAVMAIWAANVRGRSAWRLFAYGLVPLALVDLAVGFALFQSGTSSFLGLYESAVGFRGPSTFISTNHGASFLGLAALVAAAATARLRRDHPMRAAAFGVGALVLVGGALTLESDGVLLALIAAGGSGVLIQWLRRGRPLAVRADIKIGVGLLVVLSGVAAFWLDIHHVVSDFVRRVALSGEHGGRFELLRAGLTATGDFWRFGSGAGSIETALPAYVDWSTLIAASIPVIENDTLELLLSFGVPFCLVIFGACFVQFLAVLDPGTDGQRSPRYAVAIVSSIYLGIIAQLHFPLFALGIGVPAVVWLELLWSRRGKPTGGKHRFPTGHFAADWRVAAAVLAVLAVGAILSAQAHYVSYAPAPKLETESELAHEIWRRPASHIPYVKLATQAARGGDAGRAQQLAEFAVSREPSPRVRLYRAQVIALVNEPSAALAFGELFSEGYGDGRYIQRFLLAIRSDEIRAKVLAPHPAMWADAVARIHRQDGADAASSFVVGLVTQRPGDLAVYRLAAATYLRLNLPVLSKLWAELVRDAEHRQSADEHEAPLLLARALRASGRLDEARGVLDQATTSKNVVRAAHREALELRGKPGADLLDFVQRHRDAYCVSPIPPPDQRICWEAEGWLLESNGEHTTAERVYTRLNRRLADPMPLAHFYLRGGKCEDLRSLIRDTDPGPTRKRVEALAARCP